MSQQKIIIRPRSNVWPIFLNQKSAILMIFLVLNTITKYLKFFDLNHLNVAN